MSVIKQPLFQYFQFWRSDQDGLTYGRPANTHKEYITPDGLIRLNAIYRDFQAFAKDMTFEAFSSEIKPGLYDRNDIEIIIGGSGTRYYKLKIEVLTNGI